MPRNCIARALTIALITQVGLCGGCAWLAAPGSATGQSNAITGVVEAPERPATNEQPEPAPGPRSFTMVAVGDVMLDRGVWRLIEANGPQSILAKVRDELRSADITFANLECPLATSGPHAPRDCIFRADPRSVDVLLDGGVDVVSIANNHSLDAGKSGLFETMDVLDRSGVAYCGAARERESAWKPCLFEVNGVILGFIACTDLSFEHGSWCKVDQGLEEFPGRVHAASEDCDLLIVSVHWGNEYQKVPTQRQRAVAHAAVEAGADLVIGHHPHTLQGIGEHKGAPILYSTGNFVFDQREGERMESAIFHLTWTEGEGWQLRMVPVWIPRSRMGPVYPDAGRAAKIINRLAGLSENLGVPVAVTNNVGEATIPANHDGQSSPQSDTTTVPAADR